ncbi:hypothetical protein D3C87_1181040 [compost metagenome]
MGQAQLFAGIEPEAEEHRIELLMQFAEGQVLPELLPVADFDAANFQEELKLFLRVVIHQFVFGDPVFVEAASLLPRLEDHHVMPVHGAAVGAGQTCRTGTHHGDAFAGGGSTLEGVRAEVGVVHGVALQQADHDRCTFVSVVAHAGLLAKNFRRAHPGATAAEDVGREDFLRGALHVVLRNVADERRNVDLARTGIHAGRVVAIQAARGFQVRLALVERRRQIGEVAGEGGRILLGMREVVQGLDHGFGLTVI